MPFIIERLQKSELETREFLNAIFLFRDFDGGGEHCGFFLGSHFARPDFSQNNRRPIRRWTYYYDALVIVVADFTWFLQPFGFGHSSQTSFLFLRHQSNFLQCRHNFRFVGFLPFVRFNWSSVGCGAGRVVSLSCSNNFLASFFRVFVCRLISNYQTSSGFIFSRTLGWPVRLLCQYYRLAAYLAAGSVSIFNFSWICNRAAGHCRRQLHRSTFPTISRLFGNGEKEKFFKKCLPPLATSLSGQCQ